MSRSKHAWLSRSDRTGGCSRNAGRGHRSSRPRTATSVRAGARSRRTSRAIRRSRRAVRACPWCSLPAVGRPTRCAALRHRRGAGAPRSPGAPRPAGSQQHRCQQPGRAGAARGERAQDLKHGPELRLRLGVDPEVPIPRRAAAATPVRVVFVEERRRRRAAQHLLDKKRTVTRDWKVRANALTPLFLVLFLSGGGPGKPARRRRRRRRAGGMGKGGVRRGGAARWGKPTTHALQGTLQYQVQMHRDKPGPGAYNVARSAPVGGGRFGSSIAKTGRERIAPVCSACCASAALPARCPLTPARRRAQAWR
jgi:hypothetical protein